MQTTQVSTLGYKLNYNVPSDIDEFDRLAKYAGAALAEANKNVIYRSTLAEFRYAFIHGVDEVKDGETVTQPAIEGLEKLTGIERKTKVVKPEVKDADGKITQEEVLGWDEKEQAYVDRVFATQVAAGTFPSVEAAEANYQTLAQSIIDTIVFDPSKTEKVSGPKKTPKTYYSIADAIIEMAGSVEAAAAKFTAKTGIAVDATRDALAKGVWQDQVAQKAKIAAGYAS